MWQSWRLHWGSHDRNFYKKLQRDTLTAQEWQEAAKVLGMEFDQGFVLPDGTRMGVSEKREKRTVLPLMGSAFLPGKAEETVKQFEDPKLQEIARGELYFFRAPGRILHSECGKIPDQ